MEGTQALENTAIGQATAAQAAVLPPFADAVDQHKAMVYSIGWHFLRDRALAEELAQDVFVELHRHWHSIQSAEHLVYWLRRVASNRAIDCIRRRKSRHECSLEGASEPTTLEKLNDTMLKSYLERMVASLPERQRMVVVLRFQEGLEAEEISRLLKMNVSTVRTNLARALELLRAKTAGKLQAPRGKQGQETL